MPKLGIYKYFWDGRLSMAELKGVAVRAETDAALRDRLLELAVSPPSLRAGRNALWCMTHFSTSLGGWLHDIRDVLTDRLLTETDTARRRMLLQLLSKQEYDKEMVRTDLLDFCLGNINDESEPYAIRCFSLYIASKICGVYPELSGELRGYIAMLESQELSPGLKSALRKVKKKLKYD